jgi:hypothetical protein
MRELIVGVIVATLLDTATGVVLVTPAAADRETVIRQSATAWQQG